MLDPWFQRAPERRWKAIRNWFHWKLVERSVIHQARAVLFTCAEEMRLARETFRPYHPRQQINVGFGIVPPPEYHPGMAAAFAEKCPGVKGQSFILFLGRIHSKKGVDIMIQAYAAMCLTAGANPQRPPPKLVVAGPGLETAFGQQMQALATAICPPDSVCWPGMLTGDAKWGALHHAAAFVLASHQENFGIAVVEALACGTPVLISNQINIWREIEMNHAGLVEADTLTGAKQLLHRWQNLSHSEQQTLKHAAKITYETHFRVEAAAQKLLAAIQAATDIRSGCNPRWNRKHFSDGRSN
jgi:glycosyltransferase involved in cell wall biosynthesis